MKRMVHFMEGVQTRSDLYGFDYRETDLRRVSEGEEKKTYNIKALWQRSHEIINLAARGYKYTDIAEILGITPACVSLTLNSDLGQKKLSEIRLVRDEDAKKTSEKIRVLTAKAIQTYHEIFDNEYGQATLRDRKDVADTVLLELSGLRAPTKIHTSSVSTILTAEEIEAFKNRGISAAKQSGFIDITEQPSTERECKDQPIEALSAESITTIIEEINGPDQATA
jgi:predicted transcriptional regulator